MATNPYVNKVVYGDQTVIDLSSDTASAGDVLSGQTFHDRSGALVTGTALGGLSYPDNAILGAKNLLNTNSSNVRIIATNTTYTAIDTGIKVESTSSGTYQFVSFWLTNLPKNTSITISCGVTVTSGKGGIFVRDVNTSDYLLEEEISGIVYDEYTFNTGNYESLALNLYCTRATSTMGSVSYSNLMLRLSTDTDSLYKPYAMTNRELTENKADTTNLDEWTSTTTVSSGAFSFSGIDATKAYKPYVDVTGSSTNMNPSAQISTISGTSPNLTVTWTTDADEGATVKLRIIK